jgi:hypothetical protein
LDDPLDLASDEDLDEGRPSLQNIWTTETVCTTEYLDVRGRNRNKPYEREAIEFIGQFPMRESSSWIWRNELLLVHSPEEFSFPLRYFAAKFPVHLVWKRENILEQLRSALLVAETITLVSDVPHDYSMEQFMKLPGLLGLQIGEPEFGDTHELFEKDGRSYAVISGYWVSPKARSILQNHNIDGIILDTTFKVMSRYHTAILIAVFHNVGIPLAFSFGPRESFELYDRFYTVFQEEFQIDLTQYILESDQGSALKKVGARHPRHLFCLRHVLKSLHDKACGPFGSLVGNLISARSQKELRLFLKIYTPDFREVYAQNGTEKGQLARCLKKVGLLFDGTSVQYPEPGRTRWRQVSMLERTDTRMPTTSNTIECLNGHLNGKTPRHNQFWGSLHRLRLMITQRIKHFLVVWPIT